MCHALVPADKAIKVTRWVSPLRGQIAIELERQGTYVSKRPETKYYCISCAVHHGLVRVRAEEERKLRGPALRTRSIPLKFLKKQIG